MNNISKLLSDGLRLIKSHAPEILTVLGVSGVVTTAYLTGKASYKAAEAIREDEDAGGTAEDPKQRLKERTKLVWKFYIPATISGTLTIAAIAGSSRSTGKRTAAATAAYAVTERAFSEYREKVVEQIGKGKEQKIRDQIAQDHITRVPPNSKEIMILGSGDVLCCELFTHRYFRSDMEKLRKVQNDINMKIISEMYVTLDEFYDSMGLTHTSNSSNFGWDSNKLVELKFSAVLSPEGEPCLAFEYSYLKPLP